MTFPEEPTRQQIEEAISKAEANENLAPLPVDPLADHNRLTVVNMWTYQEIGEDPLTIDTRSTFDLLKLDDDPFNRRIRIPDENIVGIDFSDLHGQRGMFGIVFKQTPLLVNPSEEEQEKRKNQRVFVRLGQDGKNIVLRPESSFGPVEVLSLNEVSVWTNEPPARVRVIAFPV